MHRLHDRQKWVTALLIAACRGAIAPARAVIANTAIRCKVNSTIQRLLHRKQSMASAEV